MPWKIYYDDGDTFSDQEGGPAEAPSRGVQVIAQNNLHANKALVSGRDFYIWRDGTWFGVDLMGLYDYLLDSGLVKFGRQMTSAEYDSLVARALEDPYP